MQALACVRKDKGKARRAVSCQCMTGAGRPIQACPHLLREILIWLIA